MRFEVGGGILGSPIQFLYTFNDVIQHFNSLYGHEILLNSESSVQEMCHTIPGSKGPSTWKHKWDKLNYDS